jgi:hypothetical protein
MLAVQPEARLHVAGASHFQPDDIGYVWARNMQVNTEQLLSRYF